MRVAAVKLIINKLDTFDWLCDIPASREVTDYVEVTFKNTRKGYFRNTNGLKLTKGDLVAVEATPGHDIGTVSLVGQLLVLLQMKKNKIDPLRSETKKDIPHCPRWRFGKI